MQQPLIQPYAAKRAAAAMSKFDLRFNGIVILCVGIATGLAAIFFFA
jgi:uncharacterized protein YjeT (DUF2065 family)